jgi:vancomycin permeability regulator SanA
VRLKGKKSSFTVLPVIIIIFLLDLVFLYYLKYRNQNLSLAEFHLSSIGNFLNLLFTVLMIAGISMCSLQKQKKTNNAVLIKFTVALNILLILAAVSISVKLPLSNSYLFSHPLPEVITSFLFMLYQYVMFIFISFLWLNAFGGKELIIMRVTVNSVILVMLLFLFAFLYLSTRKDKGIDKIESKSKSNVAVVLGAAVWSHNVPSPSLAARAEKAAELLRKGYVGSVQLTGGNAPGEISEAEAAYNFIKDKNVDTSKVFLEEGTTSTSEQVEYIKNSLLSKDPDGNIYIISDSYHLTRIREICKFYNVKAEVVSSDLMLSFENKIYYKLRESLALILFWIFAI